MYICGFLLHIDGTFRILLKWTFVKVSETLIGLFLFWSNLVLFLEQKLLNYSHIFLNIFFLVVILEQWQCLGIHFLL